MEFEINTNLLNLVMQILDAEQKKQATKDEPLNWNIHSKEVMRLKNLAIDVMIAEAPAGRVLEKEDAQNKLRATLEMFKIYDN
jgi:hypothetical protein